MSSDKTAPRIELLRELVRCDPPLTTTLQGLAAHPWDHDTDLVTLSAGQAVEVLLRFVRGEVEAEQLELWAESLESREDVGLEPADELRQMLLELSTPELFGELADLARTWLDRLAGVSDGTNSD
ncbi:MAG TPA: hypothetical protein VFG98_14045 [Intrasporangium sp.]|nr:hypothetical protein [Intrasporangium sp.]